jgi:hypothetical protein
LLEADIVEAQLVAHARGLAYARGDELDSCDLDTMDDAAIERQATVAATKVEYATYLDLIENLPQRCQVAPMEVAKLDKAHAVACQEPECVDVCLG